MSSPRLTGNPVTDLYNLCLRHGSPDQLPKYIYTYHKLNKRSALVRFLGHEVDMRNIRLSATKALAQRAVATKALNMFSLYYEPKEPPPPNPRTVAKRMRRQVAAATKALDSLTLSMSTPSTPSHQPPLPNAPVSTTTTKVKARKVQPTKGKGHKKEMERMAKELSAMQVDDNESKAKA